MKPEPQIIPFTSGAEFETWLAENHATTDQGIWLQYAKKGSGITSITYDESVDSALCWGWIDGQKKGFDEKMYLIKFTPRRPRSVWSMVNVRKIAALMEAGRMQPAGLLKAEEARLDGRWAVAYEPASTATVPEELQKAIDANPEAKAFFATISKSSRYSMIYRVNDAKRQETKDRRIANYVEMLARGEAPYM